MRESTELKQGEKIQKKISMKDLVKNSENISPAGKISNQLVKTNKIEEIITSSPPVIMNQVQEHGEKNVLMEVRLAVEKCVDRLDLEMDDVRMLTLCKDIIDVFKYESIEDIRMCLKFGGQGRYGLGYNKRGVITMVMVHEWMGKYLEEKAQAREKLINNKKQRYNDRDWET